MGKLVRRSLVSKEPGVSKPPAAVDASNLLTLEALSAIPGIGSTVAKRIIDSYPGILELLAAGLEGISSIQGLSEVKAQRILDHFTPATPPAVPPFDVDPAPAPEPEDEPEEEDEAESEADELKNKQLEEYDAVLVKLMPPVVAKRLYVLTPTVGEMLAKGAMTLAVQIPGLTLDVAQQMIKLFADDEDTTPAPAAPVTAPPPAAIPRTSKKPAPDNSPAMTSESQSVRDNILAIFARHDDAKASSGSGNGSGVSKDDYMKLNKDATIVRVLGPYHGADGPAYFRSFRMHNTKTAGQFWNALDLEWLARNEPKLLKFFISEGRLQACDVRAVNEMGDPFQTLGRKGLDYDRREDVKAVWSRQRYLWNVWDYEAKKVKILETSEQLYTMIRDLVQLYPTLFDPKAGRAIQIKGNGRDKEARRYTSILPMDPSPFSLPEGAELHNLDKALLGKALGFNEKSEKLFAVYGSLAVNVNMVPNHWLGAAGSDCGRAAVGSKPEEDDIAY